MLLTPEVAARIEEEVSTVPGGDADAQSMSPSQAADVGCWAVGGVGWGPEEIGAVIDCMPYTSGFCSHVFFPTVTGGCDTGSCMDGIWLGTKT